MNAPYIPKRGDVVWLDFHPQAGHEQSGRCPAAVLSPQAYNGKVGLALFCPISTRLKGYPFEIAVPKECGVTGVVLADHVKSLDWRARRVELICQLPAPIIADIMAKLAFLITPEDSQVLKHG